MRTYHTIFEADYRARDKEAAQPDAVVLSIKINVTNIHKNE